MAKTKNFCKKPLLLVSLCLVVVFAAALIVMAIVPYSATPYTYTHEGSLSTTVSKYYVSKDEVRVDSVITYNNGTETKTSETYDAYVKDGKIYVDFSQLGLTPTEYGEINAYKIVIEEDVIATNTFTKVLMIVSIVGVSLGGVGLVLYFVLNNKGNKKASKKK